MRKDLRCEGKERAMLKKKSWENGKMVVKSKLVAFNKQTDIITTGTVYAGTQRSKCVRPWHMDEWAGKRYHEGELLLSDMNGFRRIENAAILNVIYDRDRTETVVLYEFFVMKYDRIRGGRIKDVLGHVLTDEHSKLISYSLYIPERNEIHKRRSALFEAMNYVVDGWCEMSDVERLSCLASVPKAV